MALRAQGCGTCRPTWIDDDFLIAPIVPAAFQAAPIKPAASIGPKVQDNTSGKKAQTRTYQDLLKDEYDEDTFEYYTKTELVTVQVESFLSVCCDSLPT